MDTIKMVGVTRSNFIESIHYGTAVLINSDGKILKEWGNSNMMIYPRSALKPIQSLNLYKEGVAEALNLPNELIALTTASHHAEAIHQEMINSWLKKMNLNENHLSCGSTWPWNKKDQFEVYSKYKIKRKIFHNCSGKHCGHLAVCQYKDLSIKDYQNKEHPIQKNLIHLIENLSKYKINHIGIDGCTLPNPLMPLKKFALAVAQLADYKKLNEHSAIAKRIFDSCVKFPEIAGGSKSINSILTKLSNEKVFFKNGAEGVFVLSILSFLYGIYLCITLIPTVGTYSGSSAIRSFKGNFFRFLIPIFVLGFNGFLMYACYPLIKHFGSIEKPKK